MIARVGRSESSNVRVAAFVPVLEIVSGGPVDRRMAETVGDGAVGGDAGMPALPIRERMNPDQPALYQRLFFRPPRRRARFAGSPAAA